MNPNLYSRFSRAWALAAVAVFIPACVLPFSIGDFVDQESGSNGESLSVGPVSSTFVSETSDGDEPYVVAIDEDFDDWDSEDPRFTTPRAEQPSIYEDHGTMAVVAGRQCLLIHENAVDNVGFGYTVEFQLELDERTDMTREDFYISFDVYIPAVTAEKGAHVLFSFYETDYYTPIYSEYYSSLQADTWESVVAPVDSTSGLIAFSGFYDDPGGWIFDAVRIQLVVMGPEVEEGEEIVFCVDNLLVTNDPEKI